MVPFQPQAVFTQVSLLSAGLPELSILFTEARHLSCTQSPQDSDSSELFPQGSVPLSTSRLICPPRIYMDGRGSSTLGLCLLGNSFSPPSPLPRPGECVLFWETGCSYRLHACLMQGLPHTSEYWTAALALLAPS